jgi:hypothetical protein
MSTTTSPEIRDLHFIPDHDVIRRLLRPPVGFNHPDDVLKDPDLTPAEKRAVLSSWASDANAVPSRPTLRRSPTTDDAVPLSEILAAIRRLDS